MRLDKIKLAGFKSFVDPTSIQLPSNLVGVVGPNGCGKSNVIDAVRWVMGESSAKHLRGDSMADVIFNGSTSRKPVGHAAIELVFDNTDGAIGGQYAQYNEVSIKRQVSRDGTSTYFLNGARCRRRDITDIFLGTGLGPRAYSIIEQGMISRLIEAKPEELRMYLEEAAGISKYKERRRETENRIRHARENLGRLNDLREEVEKHLQHLQRQAKTAEKYKELKQQERRLRGELLALRLRAQERESEAQARTIHERETAMEAAVAEQRSVEADLERDRAAHAEATDGFNEVQGRYYALGGDITRLEQAIHHGKEMRRKQESDLAEAERGWRELTEHIEHDERQLQELATALEKNEPALAQAREAERASREDLARAEEQMQEWQEQWYELNQRATEPSEAAQVERTRIDHLERHIVQLQQRLERLGAERDSLDASDLAQHIERLEREAAGHAEREQATASELEQVRRRIGEVRGQNQRVAEELDDKRGALQDARGRLASLEALQQAALGQTEGAVTQWLERQGLAEAPRLAQQVQVEPGWERAVETVLGFNLEAVCVDGLDAVTEVLGELNGSLALFDTGAPAPGDAGAAGTPLLSRVTAPWSLGSLLAGVYAADGLAEALALRPRLAPHESVITPEGIWIGDGWLRVGLDEEEKAGVLEREQEIKTLKARLEALAEDGRTLEDELENGRERLEELEQRLETVQAEANESHRRNSQARAQLDSLRSRHEQVQSRIQGLRSEMEELQAEEQREGGAVQEARARLAAAVEQVDALSREKETLGARREELRQALDQARARAQADRDRAHEIALRVEAVRSQQQSTRQNLERMQAQLEGLKQRRAELQEALDAAVQPMREQERELARLLERRVQVEAELADARRQVEGVEEALRAHEQQRSSAEQKVQEMREHLEQARLGWQGIKVRLQTLQEQLAETGFDRHELLEGLAEEASEEQWQEKVERIAGRIQRLGPINLAAIDEFAGESERKKYLDAQHADVTEALEILESAIRKIDRETRTRFKETYDRVNDGLKGLFPRLFGGGHAYLELTGEDLLDTGVTVMARPPGKRNSSIHLLSGGEKALTAVALVFSLFQLNPAPFCMLDEVDAPLDDANVGRFCELVKEMSDQVQFIVITHNKITMALTNQLLGVTMNEPGVSRLVAVDMEEAARMAAV